jgi:hypothetical protein
MCGKFMCPCGTVKIGLYVFPSQRNFFPLGIAPYSLGLIDPSVYYLYHECVELCVSFHYSPLCHDVFTQVSFK